MIKTFEQFDRFDPFGEERIFVPPFTKGDLVKLNHNIERDEDDGEYGYSIDSDEIGEVRYLVSSTENYGNSDRVYMLKFPDKDGKKRYIQLTQNSFSKID